MLFFFFFNDTATTEIYTLSLHDALPICSRTSSRASPSVPSARRPSRSSSRSGASSGRCPGSWTTASGRTTPGSSTSRSEEHTSELQSRQYLVCRLLLEKKNRQTSYH